MHFFWKLLLKILNSTCTIKAKEIGRVTELQKNVTLEKGSYIYAGKIGKYTFINKNCIIDKSVESIGSYCSIAYGVKIGLASHPVSWVSSHPFCYDKKYGFVENTKFERPENLLPTLLSLLLLANNLVRKVIPFAC